MTAPALVHAIRETDDSGWVRTNCGKQGVNSRVKDHFATASNGRFLAVPLTRSPEVTCSICMKKLRFNALASGGRNNVQHDQSSGDDHE